MWRVSSIHHLFVLHALFYVMEMLICIWWVICIFSNELLECNFYIFAHLVCSHAFYYPLVTVLTIYILWKACFDFARVIGSAMSYDIVPHENLIQSISTILSEDKEGLPVFRCAF